MKISTSATKLRGGKLPKEAVAYIAVGRIKAEDDKHESNIKKGEKFYLMEFRRKFYLIDVEGKDLYKFEIEKKAFDRWAKKHTLVKATTKKGSTDSRSAIKNFKDLMELSKMKVTVKGSHLTIAKAPNDAAGSTATLASSYINDLGYSERLDDSNVMNVSKGRIKLFTYVVGVLSPTLKKPRPLPASRTKVGSKPVRIMLETPKSDFVKAELAAEEQHYSRERIETLTYDLKTARARLSTLKRAKRKTPDNARELKRFTLKVEKLTELLTNANKSKPLKKAAKLSSTQKIKKMQAFVNYASTFQDIGAYTEDMDLEKFIVKVIHLQKRGVSSSLHLRDDGLWYFSPMRTDGYTAKQAVEKIIG